MSNQYVPVVKPLDQRKRDIALRREEAEAKGRIRREYKFRGGEDLPLIKLSIDDPIYRLENYRTRDQQLSLIAAGEVNADVFEQAHREESATQRIQHGLLVIQAKAGSGETITPIFDELARVAEQTEDIIISADGVVVNGNRRLSAMRELLAIDPVRFKGFGQVLCAVLPASASPQDILTLEIGLQMQPETKLPYEWTALGRAVRDLREAGMDDARIAELMNRDKVDIVRSAKMIDSADMYLGEWLDKPDSYNLLAGTEQAFRQVAIKNLGRTDDVAIREVTRSFDFFVIEQRDKLSDRAYNRINAIESNPSLFLQTMATELGIELATTAADAPTKGLVFGSVAPGIDYTPLLDALDAGRANEDTRRETIQVVEQVCQIVAEQGRAREHAALEMARRARKTLGGIDLASASVADYDDIVAVLEGCREIIDQLVSDVGVRQAKDA